MKRIVAMGGGGFTLEDGPSLLDEYVVGLARSTTPRICFIPTASGDAERLIDRFYAGLGRFRAELSHLAFFGNAHPGATPLDRIDERLGEQDIVYVGGGNTRSMLAVWREWSLDLYLRKAWEKGIVLGGASAGSICWFESGVTDSVAGPLTAMPCLRFLPGSNCPHYDSEALRRPSYRRMVAQGKLQSGLAADDGVALHFEGTRLKRIVSSLPRASAWRLEKSGRRAVESRMPARYLGQR